MESQHIHKENLKGLDSQETSDGGQHRLQNNIVSSFYKAINHILAITPSIMMGSVVQAVFLIYT